MVERPTSEEIERWWRKWPAANVGIVTGVVSGIAVLDVDPRNGGDMTLRRYEETESLVPVTAEVRTGGGGRHLYFAIDGPVPTAGLGPGLDFKGDGGMVVAPPSRHASGRSYEWRPGARPDELPPVRVPDWMVSTVWRPLPSGRRRQETAEPRTWSEQAEFAQAWSSIGIGLEPGDNYYLCPFHDDHHPSLHVDAEGCRWYCFGCEMGGGIGKLRTLLGEQRGRPRTRLTGKIGRQRPITLHGRYEVEVVGESYHQDELLELCGGRRRYGGVDVEVVAQLVLDPDNPFDPRAVAVTIDDRTVGHIGRQDLSWVGPLVDDSLDLHGFASCRAFIKGGWDRGRQGIGWFGVTLHLPTPDRDP